MKLCTGVIHSVSKAVGHSQDYAPYLTETLPSNRLKRAAVADSSLERIRGLGAAIVLAAIVSTMTITEAKAATYSVDHLKLYAHSRILDYKEFQCFNRIITKESRWSYVAKNGSHYGLGQMKSKHYRDLDPYRQIDATLKYITKRYGSSCKAWAFHQERNYF